VALPYLLEQWKRPLWNSDWQNTEPSRCGESLRAARIRTTKAIVNGAQRDYVSVLSSGLFQPIADLFHLMDQRLPAGPNEVQASPAENGQAASIIVLGVLVLESVLNRTRYVDKVGAEKPLDTLRRLGAGNLAEDAEELFVLRDVIAHNHLWVATFHWDDQGEMRLDSAEILPGYGDKKFKRVVDPDTRRTRRLGLDVFPTRVHRFTAILVLKKCAEILSFLENSNRHYVYLEPVTVQLETEFIPFYRWVDELA